MSSLWVHFPFCWTISIFFNKALYIISCSSLGLCSFFPHSWKNVWLSLKFWVDYYLSLVPWSVLGVLPSDEDIGRARDRLPQFPPGNEDVLGSESKPLSFPRKFLTFSQLDTCWAASRSIPSSSHTNIHTATSLVHALS